MTWLMVVTWLRRLPREAWCLLAVVVALLVSVWSIQRYGARRFDEGKRYAQRGVVFDSVLASRVRARVDTVQAATDTVVQRVLVTRHRVDTVLQAVPDTLWRVPQLAALRIEVTALTRQVDTLVTALSVEREALRMERLVSQRNEQASRVVIAAQADTITALKKRPTWKKAAVLSAVGAGAGVVACAVFPGFCP